MCFNCRERMVNESVHEHYDVDQLDPSYFGFSRSHPSHDPFEDDVLPATGRPDVFANCQRQTHIELDNIEATGHAKAAAKSMGLARSNSLPEMKGNGQCI